MGQVRDQLPDLAKMKKCHPGCICDLYLQSKEGIKSSWWRKLAPAAPHPEWEVEILALPHSNPATGPPSSMGSTSDGSVLTITPWPPNNQPGVVSGWPSINRYSWVSLAYWWHPSQTSWLAGRESAYRCWRVLGRGSPLAGHHTPMVSQRDPLPKHHPLSPVLSWKVQMRKRLVCQSPYFNHSFILAVTLVREVKSCLIDTNGYKGDWRKYKNWRLLLQLN